MKKKRLLMLLTAILVIALTFTLVACGGDKGNDTPTKPGTSQDTGGSTEPELKDLTGFTFPSKTVDYDGHEQKVEVVGELNGATVTYTNNKATNAGTYNAKAVISKAGYKDLTLNTTLTINKINMSDNIVFKNRTFEYDATAHKITIEGTIPQGASVVYTGGEDGKNGATNVGVYEITATVTSNNYNTKVLKANLKINSTEEDLNVVLYKDMLFFQNPLHNNYLYGYDNANVSFVSYDSPVSYAMANNKMYFFSKGLLSTSICSFDNEKVTSLFEVNGEDLVTDGTNLYYVNNSLFNAEANGIYKIAIADLENESIDPVPTKLTSIKADYLAYNNGYIYFANKKDGNKLYRIATTVNNGISTKVYDYKVSELIADGNKLYFNRHSNLTAAIYSIDLTSNPALPVVDNNSIVKKITASKGKNLTVINDYLFFMNIDMATTTIFGDGIYKAKLDGSANAEKVIDGSENKVYAFTGDNMYLYYYKQNDKHLYSYDLITGKEKDCMAGFTPPEVKEVITTYYEKTLVHNGEMYYINMKDGGKLYKYNFENGNEFRITGLQVADFAINGDYLYFASVRFMTNFDLYRINLINGEMDRISTDKCYYLTFDNDWIYYLNFSGKNTLNKMKLDGTKNTVLYQEKKVADRPITLKDGKIYFVNDPSVGYKKMLTYDTKNGTVQEVNKDTCSPLEYIIVGNKLIVVNAQKSNTLEIRDLTTNAILNTVKLGVDDARSLMVVGNDLYFYRNVAAGSSSKGLYKLDLTNNSATPVLVDDMVRDGKTYYVSNAQIVDGKLYFMNEWQVLNSVPEPTFSTGNLCSYDFTTKQIEVLN